MLSEKKADISHMSIEDIKRLISDLRIRLIELELENEKLHRAQFDLTESHSHFEQLFDFASVGYLVLNDHGLILQANQTLARMLGVIRAELVERSMTEFVHPEDLSIYEDFLQSFPKHQGNKNFTLRIKSSESEYNLIKLHGSVCHNEAGKEIWVSVVEIPKQGDAEDIKQLNQRIDDQAAELMATNCQLQKNIKELAFSKQQLTERDEKLNSIFNAAIEGIMILDEKGEIISVNEAMGDIFGYSGSELIGTHVNHLIDHKKNHKYSIKKFALNNHNTTPKITEIDGKHHDGSLIPIDLSIAEFKIGVERYFTGILRDVSQRKQKELKDKDHLDELAHVTRLGLMGEMASGIAHELNQPLTAISSYLEACLMFTSSPEPNLNKVIETMQKAKQQALHAGQIIHRIRNFVKSRKMEKAPININDLVEEAMGLCESEFKQHGIICKKELENPLPIVNIDKIHIEQVLLNLMKNSVEALSKMPKEIQKIVVIQTYMDNQNQIEVRVKDNGLGLGYDERNNILKPFFTTKESGMGMGLSISRSIVESHQGALRFNSKKGKGSTFYFTLPVAEVTNDKIKPN